MEKVRNRVETGTEMNIQIPTLYPFWGQERRFTSAVLFFYLELGEMPMLRRTFISACAMAVAALGLSLTPASAAETKGKTVRFQIKGAT